MGTLKWIAATLSAATLALGLSVVPASADDHTAETVDCTAAAETRADYFEQRLRTERREQYGIAYDAPLTANGRPAVEIFTSVVDDALECYVATPTRIERVYASAAAADHDAETRHGTGHWGHTDLRSYPQPEPVDAPEIGDGQPVPVRKPEWVFRGGRFAPDCSKHDADGVTYGYRPPADGVEGFCSPVMFDA